MAKAPETSRLLAVFSANVRHLRIAAGLTQEQLAEKAGVHRTYVGMVERSEKNVTLYNVERFADALKVEASQLLIDSRSRGKR